MTIKPRYRKKPSDEHGGYDLTVSLSLPAADMANLLRVAGIGYNLIADCCPPSGLLTDEPYWRAKALKANEAAMQVERKVWSDARKRLNSD